MLNILSKRFKDKSQHFLDRIFTSSEQKYCMSKKNSEKHFAARFCAKEAAFKALCALNIDQPDFKKIEIINQPNGAPQLILHGFKNLKAEVSLSHDKDKAIAFVTISKETQC